jgi:hypothetical protein
MFRNAVVAVVLSVGGGRSGRVCGAGDPRHSLGEGRAGVCGTSGQGQARPDGHDVGCRIQPGPGHVLSDGVRQAGRECPCGAFLGSGYNATPNERVSFTLVPLGPNTRVIADISVVTNPGSALERLTPFNNGPGSERMQEGFEYVAISNRWKPKP